MLLTKLSVNLKSQVMLGDVIEQSVLGYPANSDQKASIIVDGKNVEVKTTGVKYSTKS